jgi:RNA polymerase sigma-70 factor (ECF subfamily)
MTDLCNVSDTELIAACYGDIRELAFTTLYARYNRLVRKFVQSLRLVQKYEVEDVLQMAWHKVSRNLHTFNYEKGCFRNWLFQIANRCARNVLRDNKRKKRGGLETIISLEEVYTDFSVELRTGRYVKSPDEIMEWREELDRTIEAINCLPQPERDVMKYVYIEGLSYKETSEVMGESSAILRARVHRVREKLSRGMKR